MCVCGRVYIYTCIFHKILCTRDVANPICIFNRTGPWRLQALASAMAIAAVATPRRRQENQEVPP